MPASLMKCEGSVSRKANLSNAPPHEENQTGCRGINIYHTTSTEGDLIFFSFHSRLFIKPHSAELVSVLDLQTKRRIFRKPINFNSRRHCLIPALMPEKRFISLGAMKRQ